MKQTSELLVKVVCLSPKFGLGQKNDWTNEYSLHVKSPPKMGRANREIETGLEKFFGVAATITSGHKSAHKKIRIHASNSEVKKHLAEISEKNRKT